MFFVSLLLTLFLFEVWPVNPQHAQTGLILQRQSMQSTIYNYALTGGGWHGSHLPPGKGLPYMENLTLSQLNSRALSNTTHSGTCWHSFTCACVASRESMSILSQGIELIVSEHILPHIGGFTSSRNRTWFQTEQPGLAQYDSSVKPDTDARLGILGVCSRVILGHFNECYFTVFLYRLTREIVQMQLEMCNWSAIDLHRGAIW